MKTREQIADHIGEVNPEALLADGFEEAYLGICNRFGQPSIAAYNYDKCIDILTSRDGMERETAEEFFDFNVIGAFAGDGTPCFVTLHFPFITATQKPQELPPITQEDVKTSFDMTTVLPKALAALQAIWDADEGTREAYIDELDENLTEDAKQLRNAWRLIREALGKG